MGSPASGSLHREDRPHRDPRHRLRGKRPGGRSPVVLLHGFPDDIHAYDGVAPPLAAAGWHRVIVPYLRGYGPTRFLDPDTPRSGQQAALGHDLLDLIDALDLKSPILAGYDWGGRAACIVAALWPERVGGLVSINGYNIQNIAAFRRARIRQRRISALVPVVFPHRAGPRRARRRTADPCAGSYGNCGRRTSASATPTMSGLRRRLTIPISSMS